MTYTVNTNGINQIKQILMANHKSFQEQEPTESMLYAWASDVEDSLNNGNDASFEIKSWDHIFGNVEAFKITTDGYDNKVTEEE